MIPDSDIEYLSLLSTRQDLTWGLFYSGFFLGKWEVGYEWASTFALLDYVGLWFTGCNVNQIVKHNFWRSAEKFIAWLIYSHGMWPNVIYFSTCNPHISTIGVVVLGSLLFEKTSTVIMWYWLEDPFNMLHKLHGSHNKKFICFLK